MKPPDTAIGPPRPAFPHAPRTPSHWIRRLPCPPLPGIGCEPDWTGARSCKVHLEIRPSHIETGSLCESARDERYQFARNVAIGLEHDGRLRPHQGRAKSVRVRPHPFGALSLVARDVGVGGRLRPTGLRRRPGVPSKCRSPFPLRLATWRRPSRSAPCESVRSRARGVAVAGSAGAP